MDSCSTHGNVQRRFFCTTCTVPVCHVCMERGDHVIPNHQCIPMSQYCEKKSNEIRTLLQDAAQHKTKYDQVKLKWDTHLSSLEGEYGRLKTEIRLTKQHLLHQMDLAEKSLLETAAIAKARNETAISSAKVSHEKKFSDTYQQLLKKCQSLLRKLSSQILDDKHAYEECHNLLNTLQEDLANFDKEDVVTKHFTFVPATTCYLGEVIAPNAADYIAGSTLESVKREGGEIPAKKRKVSTDSGTNIPQIKKEYPPTVSSNENGPSTKLKTMTKSSSGFNVSGQVDGQGNSSKPAGNLSSSGAKASISTSKSINNPARGTPLRSPNASGPTVPSPTVQKSFNKKSDSTNPVQMGGKTHSSVNNFQVINVDSQCCGIVWPDDNSFFEILTTKNFISVKQHKISDHGPLQTTMNIKCNQIMEGVKVYVCSKIYSADYSLVFGFNDQVGIIRLKGNIEVTWRRIPSQFTIQAISWWKDSSNFVAIVNDSKGGKVSVIKAVSASSGQLDLEVRGLADFSSQVAYSFGISFNSEFAICNTLSNRIWYFSNLSEFSPKKEVLGPSKLVDAKPVFLLFKDDKKEWVVLWKGTNPSEKRPKFIIVRYNINFVPLATVIEYNCPIPYDEPKAFSVCNDKLAVLHNNLRVVFHHKLSTMS